MNRKHFHEDGETTNGIVESMLDEIAEAIVAFHVNRKTCFKDFSDEQFMVMTEMIVFFFAANLGYKSSLLTMRVNEKLEERRMLHGL